MDCIRCDEMSKAEYVAVTGDFVEVSADRAGGYAVSQLSAIRLRDRVDFTTIEYLDMGGCPVLAVLHVPSKKVYEFSLYASGFGEMRRYPLKVWIEEFCR